MFRVLRSLVVYFIRAEMVDDRREVGAGARRHELGGLNGSGGKFLCGELRNLFTILWPRFLRRPLVGGGKIVALAVLELYLACW